MYRTPYQSLPGAMNFLGCIRIAGVAVAAVAAWEYLLKDRITQCTCHHCHDKVNREGNDQKKAAPALTKDIDEVKYPDGNNKASEKKAEEKNGEPRSEQKADSEVSVINFEKGFEDVARPIWQGSSPTATAKQ